MIHETTAIPPTPRARRRDANLARILEAAMDLVAEGGLEALSMGRLAQAVDYTPGALYRYFPSKDALLAALVAQVLDELQAFLAQRELPKAPLARVFALTHGFRLFALARPHPFGFLSRAIAEPRVLVPGSAEVQPVAERAIALLELLATALDDATQQGQLDAAPEGGELERTLCLFSLVHGLLQLQKQTRFESKLAERGASPLGTLAVEPLVTHGVRTLLIGWGAKPRSVDAAATEGGRS